VNDGWIPDALEADEDALEAEDADEDALEADDADEADEAEGLTAVPPVRVAVILSDALRVVCPMAEALRLPGAEGRVDELREEVTRAVEPVPNPAAERLP